MEQIHANVLVAVAPSASGALQYVIDNSGLDSVHMSVDFRQSSNVQLHFPQSDEPSTAKGLVFDTIVHPFQRHVMVMVKRQQNKRALVRVDYLVKESSATSVEQVDQAQDAANAVLAQALLESQASYGSIRRSSRRHWISSKCSHSVDNFSVCREINAFAVRTHRRFVDEVFAPCFKSLVAADGAIDALWSMCTWTHVHDAVDECWSLWPKRSTANAFHEESQVMFKCMLPGQESFISALNVLSLQPHGFWTRVFPCLPDNVDTRTLASLCIRVCENGLQWRHVLLDMYQPSFPIGQGLMGARSSEGGLCGMLLQKAVAKLKRSYAAIARVPTITLLRELTGIPWIMAYDSQSVLASGCSNSAAEQALRLLICSSVERYKRRVAQPSPSPVFPAILVSFGKLDGHLCAFPVIGTVAKNALILIPDDRGMLVSLFGTNSDSDPSTTDSALLRIPWSALLQADLRVFALLHDHQYEQRRRIRQWLDPDDSIRKREYKSALSVAALSNIVILCGLSHCSERGDISSTAALKLQLEFVEQDFSTTDHAIGKSECIDASSEGLLVRQNVVTLSAGEYILTILIDKTNEGKTALYSEERTDRGILTVDTMDENLHFLFDCIDQDMDERITTDELASFFQLYERQSGEWLSSVQNGPRTKVLDSFLSHFAGHNDGGTSMGLSSEDLLAAYRFLAARNDGNLVKNHEALKEYVWGDLCLALCATTASQNKKTQTNPATEIHMHDIEELLCTLHSDTPFLQFVTLPSSP